jgi:hypothetical protein
MYVGLFIFGVLPPAFANFAGVRACGMHATLAAGDTLCNAAFDGILGLALDGDAKLSQNAPIDWIFQSANTPSVFSIFIDPSDGYTRTNSGRSVLYVGGYSMFSPI